MRRRRVKREKLSEDSFGSHRCALLAGAFAPVVARGGSVDELVEAARSALVAGGYDVEAPYLAPRSGRTYELSP